MLHLEGNNAPVADERDAVPTSVVGEVPAELRGWYVRNGPNPVTGWSPHLYAGDGMVHAIAIDGGVAGPYRNRYVRTPLHANPGADRMALAYDAAAGRLDWSVTTANTHVVAHAGRVLALEEGGLPYELTLALDTVGPFTFGGALDGPMTAHPKTCPTTGELLFFGASVVPPYLTYHRADASGALVQSAVIELSRASMMHDFGVTASSVLFLDSSVVFDRKAAASGLPPWRWDDDHPARIGVMPRAGGDVRWFEIEPCHVSHTANAYDDGDAIVLTGTRIDDLWREGAGDMSGALPALHRWTIELGSGVVREEPLDDDASEYPRVPDAAVGLEHRFVYTARFVLDAEPDHGAIHRYDLVRDERATHVLPDGHTCGEAVFVPRDGARSEDDGWLLAFAHDRGAGTSYLLVLDAADVAGPPVAEVHLPLRIPGGFHGSWLPAARMEQWRSGPSA